MKKYLSVLFLIAFIVPSVALASWWNPFSWFNGWTFHKTEVAPQTPIVSTEAEKTPEEKISDLQKQLDDLKKQQPITPSEITPPAKEVKKTTPVVDNSKNTKIEVNMAESLVGSYRGESEIIGLNIKKLQLISDDSERYINGIPRNASYIKQSYGLISSEVPVDLYTKAINLTDELFNSFINMFKLEKSIVDNYIKELQDLQITLNNKMISVKSSYVSLFSFKDITDAISQEESIIYNKVEKINKDYSAMVDNFISKKDLLGQSTYDAVLKVLSNATTSISVPPRSSFTTNCFYTSYGSGGGMNCYSY